ncbi:MAG: hypothetical protein AB1390_07490 [Nitrospirota bacterium]
MRVSVTPDTIHRGTEAITGRTTRDRIPIVTESAIRLFLILHPITTGTLLLLIAQIRTETDGRREV